MSNFYNNYLSLCALIKKSPSRVANEIGLSNAAANGWKRGKAPSDVTLEKLSIYFNVPVSVLTGEQKETAPTVTDKRDLEMLSMISQLTPEQKKMLTLQIKGLLQKQE